MESHCSPCVIDPCGSAFTGGGGLSTSLDGVVPAVVVSVIGKLVTDKPLTKPFKNRGDSIILIGETDDDGNDTIFRAGLAKEMKPAKPLFREERTGMESALAAIRTGFMHSLSDLGAAGIGAAVCEAAKTSGLGAEIELSKVPIKQKKQLNPAELILNKTQARYSFTVSPENAQRVPDEIREAGGVGTVIGEVKEDTKTIFRHDGEVAASISNRPSKEALNFLENLHGS